jgi:WD40 repeat protein/tetratricopeptide (TPR) repeat protein
MLWGTVRSFAWVVVTLALAPVRAPAEKPRPGRERRAGEARLYLDRGARALADGDWVGSLPWFARALELEAQDPARSAVHRTRVAAVMQESPRVVRLWSAPAGRGSLGPAHLVLLSPDAGRAVAVCGQQSNARDLPGRSTVGVWDVRTGKPVGQPLTLDPLFVDAAGFAADGAVLCLGGQDNRVNASLVSFNTADQRPFGPRIDSPGKVRELALSPTRPVAATVSAEQKHARVWDLKTGKLLFPPLAHDHPVRLVRFSPNGKYLLTTAGPAARVWDAATGKGATGWLALKSDVSAAGWAPDGTKVVLADDRGFRVWDALAGKALADRPTGDRVSAAWFTPDGKKVAALDGRLRLWDWADPRVSPEEVNTDRKFRDRPLCDGWRVYAAAEQGGKRLGQWNLASGKPFPGDLPHPAEVTAKDTAADGRFVLTACADGGVRLWDLKPRRPAGPPAPDGDERPPADAHHVRVRTVLSPDHRCAVKFWHWTERAAFSEIVTPRPFHIYETASGKVLHRLKIPLPSGGVGIVKFSPDGRRLAVSGLLFRDVYVVDLVTGRLVAPPLHAPHPVNDVAFTPDNARVAVAYGDTCGIRNRKGKGGVRVWEARTGKPVTAELDTTPAPSVRVAFSPNGRTLLALCGGEAMVWAVDSGKPVGRPLALGGDGVIEWFAFSPDGRRVVAGGSGGARVWDVSTARPVSPPLQPRDSVSAVAFGPDGSRVAVGTISGTTRVWDVRNGEPVTPSFGMRRATGSLDIRHLEFTADGRYLLTISGEDGDDHEARCWDAATGRPVGPPIRSPGTDRGRLTFTTGGRVTVASRGRQAQLWDSLTGEPVSPLVYDGPWLKPAASYFGGFNPSVERTDVPQPAHAWELPACKWSKADLAAMARLQSGFSVDPAGALVPVPISELEAAARDLRREHPEAFAVPAAPKPSPGAWEKRFDDAARAAKGGDWPLAAAEFAAAGDLGARHWAVLYNRGLALARLGRWGEADAELTSALLLRADLLHPRADEVWLARGLARLMLGRPEAALADLGEIDPAWAGAWRARLLAGFAHARSGRRLEAGRAVSEGMVRWYLAGRRSGDLSRWLPGIVTAGTRDRVRVDDPAAWVTRGDRCARRGQRDEAAFDYRQARALGRDGAVDTRLAEAYLRLAEREIAANGSMSAVEEYATRGLELAENDWRLWKVRATSRLESLLRADGAVKDAERARRLRPHDPGVRALLARAYNRQAEYRILLKDWKAAETAFGKAVHADPGDHRNWLARAKARLQLRDWAGAISDFTAAADGSPPRSEARAKAIWGRGRAHAEAGAWEKAGDDLRMAVSEQPRDADFLYCLALYYLSRNDTRAAAVRRDLLSLAEASAKADDWNEAAWLAALAPLPGREAARAVKLARRAVEENKEDANRRGTLGAILYRAGRVEEAVEHLRFALDKTKDGDIENTLVLAAAVAKRGNMAEARERLEAAEKLIRERRPSWDWETRAGVALLQAEARRTVTGGK